MSEAIGNEVGGRPVPDIEGAPKRGHAEIDLFDLVTRDASTRDLPSAPATDASDRDDPDHTPDDERAFCGSFAGQQSAAGPPGSSEEAEQSLLEVSPYAADGGELIGRDPRRLTPADFAAAGITLRRPMKAVRAKCVDCCSGNESEVRKCVSRSCPLWPMRMGSLPRALRQALKVPLSAGTDTGIEEETDGE